MSLDWISTFIGMLIGYFGVPMLLSFVARLTARGE